MAVIVQVPAVTIVTVALALAVQTAEVLEVKVTVPVPLPPLTVGVKGASPYVLVAGPVIVRVAWAALLTVTEKGTEVVAL